MQLRFDASHLSEFGLLVVGRLGCRLSGFLVARLSPIRLPRSLRAAVFRQLLSTGVEQIARRTGGCTWATRKNRGISANLRDTRVLIRGIRERAELTGY